MTGKAEGEGVELKEKPQLFAFAREQLHIQTYLVALLKGIEKLDRSKQVIVRFVQHI